MRNTSGAWVSYAQYIERDHANPERSSFNADDQGISGTQQAGRWQRSGDEVMYRMMFSPEERMADYKQFTRDLMERIEQDLGTKLEWFAAVHVNTSHWHVHIAVRGVDDRGKTLEIPGSYLNGQAFKRARQVATEHLGYRTTERKGPEQSREITPAPRISSGSKAGRGR